MPKRPGLRSHELAIVLTVFSAVCFSLAIPNETALLGNPFLALIMLVPLYLAILAIEKARTAVLLGLVFSVLTTLMSEFWMAHFGNFAVWALSGVVLGNAFFYLLFFPVLWAAMRVAAAARPLIFAALWALFEFLRSSGYLGFPWSLAAYPFGFVLPFVQASALAGIWPLSFLVLLFNAVIGEALARSKLGDSLDNRFGRLPFWRIAIYLRPTPLSTDLLLRYAAWLAGVLAAIFAYGLASLSFNAAPEKYLDLVLVQQNMDSWRQGQDSVAIARAQTLSESSAFEGSRPDMVVWSENSLDYVYPEYRDALTHFPPGKNFVEFLRGLGAPLFTGAPHVQGDAYANAAQLIGNDAEVIDWYGKRKLIPIAEQIPLSGLPLIGDFLHNVVGLPRSGWVPGPVTTIFRLVTRNGAQVSFATPICFEDSFPYIARKMRGLGAEIMINLTNDEWSKTLSAETQHFVAARFRSIETRSTLVRSTNAGLSAVIDPWGRVLSSLPMFKAAALRTKVPVFSQIPPPPYVYLGDFFPYSIAVLFCALAIAQIYYEKTERRVD